MDPVASGIIGMLIFFIIMFLGFNIPFAMLFGGAVGLLLIAGPSVASTMIAAEFINTFSSYTLTVAPLFGLMGFVASFSGIGEKLFNCIKTYIGHKRGGLPMAVQVANVGFGAICGSALAANATFTAVAYPEMRKEGYAVELAALSIVNGGLVAVLLPPSTTKVLYGIATETSIAHLFMAGFLPALLALTLNIFTIWIILKARPHFGSVTRKYSWRERWAATRRGGIIEIACVFTLAMGGMFAGFFTPTEAAAVGAFGMLVVAAVSRQLTWSKFTKACFQGLRLAAMMYFLLASANVLGRMFVLTRIPIRLGQWVEALGLTPLAVVAVIILIYLILGLFSEMNSMMLLTLPMFFPLVVDYAGFSPLWFCNILIILMGIGAVTPPVGVALFFQKGFIQPYDPDVPVSLLFRASYPWLLTKLAGTIILIAFPQITTILPHLFYGAPL